MYDADPNDSTKQVPKPSRNDTFNSAVVATAKQIYPNAHHVLINQTGSYSFLYHTTASVGNVDHEGNAVEEKYVLGYINNSRAADTVTSFAPIKLDISPAAWSGSNALFGDVTFVYKGK